MYSKKSTNGFLNALIRKSIHLANVVIPKNNKIIYLRSSFMYPDNIQAVLDYMLTQELNTKYKIICVGNGFDGYNNPNLIKIRDKTSKALWYFFRSKFVIYDIGIFYSIPAIKKQITINLWHGTSLKRIGFYESHDKPYRTSTYAISYSTLFAKKISKAFGIPIDNVLITGEPRNDYLFSPADNDALAESGIPVSDSVKYVIWMPTFRQSKNHDVNNGKKYEFGFPFINSENISKLNECAKKNNLILILKWHGSQILPEKVGSFSNLVFLTTENVAKNNIPFYSIVSRCSALITDYSSIYVNYAVLNRPMCFAYDDIDEYIKDRGFMFKEVEKIMPGFKAHNFSDLISFLESVASGNDDYVYERERMRLVLNQYNDNNNSKRLVDFLNL